jgi:hypothetical protein
MCKRNIEARSGNYRHSGRAISITYSDYMLVALGIQRVMRMPHVVVSGLSGCTIFSTLSHKWHDCRKKSC